MNVSFSIHAIDGIERQISAFDGIDGFTAHQHVPMDCWCVTRADLFQLKTAVRERIKTGSIIPTDLDPFDVDDTVYGPCIHTVVSQFIKPATNNLARGRSWALMQHKEGLLCDLFITHGWEEGIYEFIDKVINSWPRGTHHAYCCMLSNPQNLDIGSLIASPAESPFAKALQAAQCVLVIPNRRSSIYSRIWCVYEAFLACKWNKDIYLASSPSRGFALQVAIPILIGISPVVMGLIFGFGFFESSYVGERALHIRKAIPRWVDKLVPFGVLLFPPTSCLRLFNYFGALEQGLSLVIRVWREMDRGIEDPIKFCLQIRPRINDILFYAASEADRMYMAQLGVERKNLRRGFTGHVVDARSSVVKDRATILAEIKLNHEETEVDHAIEVLVRSGMSTEALRTIAARGVFVESAGYFRIAFLVLVLGQWFGSSIFIIYDGSIHRQKYGNAACGVAWYLSFMVFLECVAYVIVFCRSHADSRAFVANVVFQIGIPCSVLRQVRWSLYYNVEPKSSDWCHPALQVQLLHAVSAALCVFLAMLGMVRLSATPYAGTCLLSYIMAGITCPSLRGHCRSFRHTFVRRLRTSGDDVAQDVVELQAFSNHCPAP